MREIGHFVEEERASIRLLEFAAPAADAGRGPIFDPEQFRLEERFDERGTIDGDEWTAGPAAPQIDLPGGDFLADPALALDEHREIRASHTFDLLPQRLRLRARADEQVAFAKGELCAG